VSGLPKVFAAVEFWVAVVAATASIAAAVISRSGDSKGNSQSTRQEGSTQDAPKPAASINCLSLLERTRAWANAYPRDAAAYAAAGDADAQGLPSLWSHEERQSCSADPERLLERNPR
jgi:hypothetical protein